MNALAQQQQALLGTLLALPGSAQAADAVTALRALVHSPWARGLAAYQANGHELAERSLRAAYPWSPRWWERRQLCHDGVRALAPPSARARRSGLLGRCAACIRRPQPATGRCALPG
ncbi:MAG: hypothetical protein IPK05_15655 [Comamonadaceae bacterium]|nr:hypothetical protein [Comamonadaceae bacterium]